MEGRPPTRRQFRKERPRSRRAISSRATSTRRTRVRLRRPRRARPASGSTAASARPTTWTGTASSSRRPRASGSCSATLRSAPVSSCIAAARPRSPASTQGGTTPEVLHKTLAAGTYAVKVIGKSQSSTQKYALMIWRLPKTVTILGAKTSIEGSTLRLVGEVYNNTADTRHVTVTARLYNAAGTLLATRTAATLVSKIKSHGRSPYLITGSLPANYAKATLTVSSSDLDEGRDATRGVDHLVRAECQRTVGGSRDRPQHQHELRRHAPNRGHPLQQASRHPGCVCGRRPARHRSAQEPRPPLSQLPTNPTRRQR